MTNRRAPDAANSDPKQAAKPQLDMAAGTFMRTIWQRHSHLVRAALPGFEGFLDRAHMMRLAQRDDVESRLVIRDGRHWALEHGPFSRSRLGRLPPTHWTLLVQGIDLHLEAGAQLLRGFDFVPRARLDDLMVSYAAPGGGVGPHFDSYDVFLLQGPGRRRWRIGAQADLALRPSLPVKILQRFRPENTWILGPGDMLYLPPRYAHDGVALDECLTYSIGFRAPSHAEFARAFFERVAERIDLEGRYSDAATAPAHAPGRLPARLADAMAEAVRRVRWTRQDVEECLGAYLSEPKPHIFYTPPPSVPAPAALARLLSRHDLVLHRKSLLLYSAAAAYLNGEVYRYPRGVPRWLRTLADRGSARLPELPPPALECVREWLAAGYVTLDGHCQEDAHHA